MLDVRQIGMEVLANEGAPFRFCQAQSNAAWIQARPEKNILQVTVPQSRDTGPADRPVLDAARVV